MKGGGMSEPKHSWRLRRRFMFAVAAFCMASISVALVFRADAPVSPSVVSFGFGTLTGIVGSYVFGAVWDDRGRDS